MLIFCNSTKDDCCASVNFNIVAEIRRISMKYLAIITILFLSTFMSLAQEKTIAIKKSEGMLYAMVRIRSASSTGSGTILYSEDREKDGRFKTFILTNHHVVESAIKIEKKWNNLFQRYEDKEVLDRVVVEVFKYSNSGKEDGRTQYDADVVAYEADEDIALLQLTVGTKMDFVARILPETVHQPSIFDTVYAVGCSLAHSPLPTKGEITSINETIDRKSYWMISSPIIWGNSGGAVFVERYDGYWWIGVPSRVATSGGQIIPHMAYIIPLDRIKSWIEKQKLVFLLNDNITPIESFEQRNKFRTKTSTTATTPNCDEFFTMLP